MFLLVQNDVYPVNIRNENLKTVSLFSFASLAVFTKSNRMGGVIQRAVFKVTGPKNLFLSRLSPTKPSTMAMLGTNPQNTYPYVDKPSKECLAEQPQYDCGGVRTDQSVPTKFSFAFGWICRKQKASS